MESLPQADPLALAVAVAADIATQPELFGSATFSAEELEIVREARSGRYTGKVTTRNQARVAVVVALRQQGCSFREIERRTGMDTRLVSVVLREAERTGIVPALKEGILRRVAETTERALDRLNEELDSPSPDAQLVRALGVTAGIGLDKVAGAATSAGDVHHHQHVHLGDSDAARDYLRLRAATLATESESAEKTVIPSETAGIIDVSAVVTAQSGVGGQFAMPPRGPDPEAPTDTPNPDEDATALKLDPAHN